MNRWINYDFADKSWFKGQREIPQAIIITAAVILTIILLEV